MYAAHHSARLAPKKANLMAKMVRGLRVDDAMELLRKTHKKSARLFETVLRSAMANAEHNFKQDPNTMVLNHVVVNQGTAYRRGVPMARGRVRPIRKFLCHIEIGLSHPEAMKVKAKKNKSLVEVEASKSKKSASKKTSASTK